MKLLKRVWLPPLFVAALMGCAQQPESHEPLPPVSGEASTPSPLKVGMQAQSATAEIGNYISVPLTLSAQDASLLAAEITLNYDPGQLKLVGIESKRLGVFDAIPTEAGKALATVVLAEGTQTLELQAVFQLTGSSASSVKANVQSALDEKGRLVTPTVETSFNVTPGQGGQAQAPVLASLNQQLEAAQQKFGVIKANSLATFQLQVPTTPDVTWLDYEAGDLNQDGKVDLADTNTFTRIVWGTEVPKPYQAYIGDLKDQEVDGKQMLNADDYWAMLNKRAQMLLAIRAVEPIIHPLRLKANTVQKGLLSIGNAQNGPLDVQATTDQPWISLEALPGKVGINTKGFYVKVDAEEGMQGNVILTFPHGGKRTISVTALAPAPMPNQVVSQYNATLENAFSALTFTKRNGVNLKLSSANPVWDPKSHVFSAEVTLENAGQTTYPGVKAILRNASPTALQVVNPSGHASDDAAFFEYGQLVPGQKQTIKWRVYSPQDQTGGFRVDLASNSGEKLGLASASPQSFSQDAVTTITVRGKDIRAETAFFIESVKLQVQSWTENSAELIVPAGFPTSTYGIMAVNPNGDRAVLYPAITIIPGAEPAPLDPKAHARSFADGFVIDIKTKQPIAGAKVGIPGLTTTTADNGYFLLRGVPQGRQPIEIDADGYEKVYRFAQVNGEKQTVTLKLAELEPKSTNVTIIGPEGGTHYANDGSFLKVPAGALDQNVPIEFTQLTGANALPELPQDGYFLAFARLGPTGLTFKKPATLYLPLQPGISIPDGTPIRISYYNEKDAQWVQDITGGVITTIEGKQFLEYEINHFTWIGGQWIPIPVTGCVTDTEGNPLAGITTNWGITDSTGRFHGSTSSSDNPRNLSANVYGADVLGAEAVQQYTSGSNGIEFKCIVVKNPQAINISAFYVYSVKPDCIRPSSISKAGKITASSVTSKVTKATTNTILLSQGETYRAHSVISDASRQQIDFSKTRLLLNGRDIADDLDVSLLEDGRPIFRYTGVASDDAAGLDRLELHVESRSGNQATSKTELAVVDHFESANINIIQLEDAALPEGMSTPYYVDSEVNRSVIVRRKDMTDGYVNVNVPIRSVTKDGSLIKANGVAIRLPGASKSAILSDGIAEVNVNLSPNTSTVDISTVSVEYYISGETVTTDSEGIKRLDISDDGCTTYFPVYTREGALPKVTFFDWAYSTSYGKLITDWISQTADQNHCFGNFCFTIGNLSPLLAMTPYAGDAGVLAQQATNWLMGKGVDPVEATLSGMSLAADVSQVGLGLGTVGSGLVTVYKLSREGFGYTASAVSRILKTTPGLSDYKASLEILRRELSFVIDIFKHDPINGVGNFDNLVKLSKRSQTSDEEAFRKAKEVYEGLSKQDFEYASGNYDSSKILSYMNQLSNVEGAETIMTRIRKDLNDITNLRGDILEIVSAKSAVDNGDDLIALSRNLTSKEHTGASGKPLETDADFIIGIKGSKDTSGLPEGTTVFVDTKSSWNSVKPGKIRDFFLIALEYNAVPRIIVDRGFHPNSLAAVVDELRAAGLEGKGQIFDSLGNRLY